MKHFSGLVLGATVLASQVYGHYIFERLTANGVEYEPYEYIRANTNYNSPVTDLTSNDLRCNAGATGSGTDTVAVPAGSFVSFTADGTVYHNGPISFYMAKAPTNASGYDGSGQKWFKIKDIGPTFDVNNNTVWDLKQTYEVELPRQLPNGDYLLRIQHLAIHNPYPAGIPQFYISCAQISIIGGGNGNPNPLVSIPGFITGTEPGYTVNIYNNFHNYTVPGPAIWDPDYTDITTSTSMSTTLTTSTISTTDTSATTTESPTETPDPDEIVMLYQQCGGRGWEGPTKCVGELECVTLSADISRCIPGDWAGDDDENTGATTTESPTEETQSVYYW